MSIYTPNVDFRFLDFVVVKSRHELWAEIGDIRSSMGPVCMLSPGLILSAEHEEGDELLRVALSFTLGPRTASSRVSTPP